MPSGNRALATALGLFAMLVLGSCGTIDGVRDGRPGHAGSGAGQGRRPVSDTPVKIGKPYTVRGVTYTPADTPGYDAVGYASWYGAEQAGNNTANGERFQPSGITAAHRTLPLPSYVEVTALDSGRTILVRVNDRGPFTGSRIIDLSRGAAEQLGALATPAAVRVRRVDPPESERAALRAGRRVEERVTASPALRAALRARLAERPQG